MAVHPQDVKRLMQGYVALAKRLKIDQKRVVEARKKKEEKKKEKK